MHTRSARSGIAVIGASLAALLAAGPAHAEVTQSHITTPSSPFFAYTDENSENEADYSFTVAGTSDGTEGDSVYITCFGDGYSQLGELPVGADGTFSGAVTKPSDVVCQDLIAVPYDVNQLRARAYDPDTDFTGPSAGFGDTYLSGGTGATPIYDYFVQSATLSTINEQSSIGDCGLNSAAPVNTNGVTYESAWYCAGGLFGYDSTYDSSRLTVDGHDASLPDYYFDRGARRAAVPGLTVDRKFDPATGQWTIKETATATLCADAAGNPSDDTCAQDVDSGVSITRTSTESQAGRVVTFSDVVSSTDGKQHAVRLLYTNGANGYNSQLPGEAQPTQHYGSYDLGGSSTGTIYVESYDNGPYAPDSRGALTYLTAPSFANFQESWAASMFTLRYDRTIPAGGSTTITQQYATGMTTGEVQAAAQAVEDASSAPTVAITSPAANTSVTSDRVTVIGTAADNGDVLSLKVNGIPTTVGGDGGWSQQVSLSPGVNAITAVVTDGAGQTAQATTSVVYSPPTAPVCKTPALVGQTSNAAGAAIIGAGCTIGNVTYKAAKQPKGSVLTQSRAGGSTLPAFFPIDLVLSSGPVGRAKVTSKSAGVKKGRITIKVSCPAGGNACPGTLKLTTRKKLGGKKRTLGSKPVSGTAGKSRSIVFTLSEADRKRLDGKTVKAYASIVFRDEAGKTQTRKYKVTIKG